ncbi:hypothetical protein INR49_012752, partial [Caranx melampygus]
PVLEPAHGCCGGFSHVHGPGQFVFGLLGFGGQPNTGDFDFLRAGDVPQPVELVLGHALLLGFDAFGELVLIWVRGLRTSMSQSLRLLHSFAVSSHTRLVFFFFWMPFSLANCSHLVGGLASEALLRGSRVVGSVPGLDTVLVTRQQVPDVKLELELFVDETPFGPVQYASQLPAAPKLPPAPHGVSHSKKDKPKINCVNCKGISKRPAVTLLYLLNYDTEGKRQRGGGGGGAVRQSSILTVIVRMASRTDRFLLIS